MSVYPMIEMSRTQRDILALIIREAEGGRSAVIIQHYLLAHLEGMVKSYDKAVEQ